jgi:hypothetical protein
MLTDVQDKKHRFRQSDNINYFLTFVRSIGMPEVSRVRRERFQADSPLDIYIRTHGSIRQEEHAKGNLLHSCAQVCPRRVPRTKHANPS